MNALDWIRSKATVIGVDEFGCEGRKIKATTFGFRGQLPNKMVPQLKKPALIKTDEINETLALNGQYRSDYGKCEYTKTVYEAA